MPLRFSSHAGRSVVQVAALASLPLLFPLLTLGGETSSGLASPFRTTAEAFDARAWTPMYPRGYDLDGRTGSMYAPSSRDQILRIFAGSETTPSIVTDDFSYNVPSSVGPVGTLFYYNGESAMLGGPFCGYGAIGQYIPTYDGGGSAPYPTFPVHGVALGYPGLYFLDLTGQVPYAQYLLVQISAFLAESRNQPSVAVGGFAIPDVASRRVFITIESSGDGESPPTTQHFTYSSAWTGRTDPPYYLLWGDRGAPPPIEPAEACMGESIPVGQITLSFCIEGFTTDTVSMPSRNWSEYTWYPVVAPVAENDAMLPSRIGFVNRPPPSAEYQIRASVDSLLGYRPVAGTFVSLDVNSDGVVDSGDLRLSQETGK